MGGIGLSKEYSSDILDSILVLEAVNSLDNTYHNNTTWKIVTYIARQMNKDGSFSYTKNSDSNVILTAMALYTVGKYMSDNKITSGLTADMISKSTTYLQKKFDKTFPEETIEENIYIALALLENNALEDVEAVVNNLSEIQKDNGSFCDDDCFKPDFYFADCYNDFLYNDSCSENRKAKFQGVQNSAGKYKCPQRLY